MRMNMHSTAHVPTTTHTLASDGPASFPWTRLLPSDPLVPGPVSCVLTCRVFLNRCSSSDVAMSDEWFLHIATVLGVLKKPQMGVTPTPESKQL